MSTPTSCGRCGRETPVIFGKPEECSRCKEAAEAFLELRKRLAFWAITSQNNVAPKAERGL